MDCKAIQIVDIITNDNKTDYILNTNALQQILTPIEDKKVAVISIAGPSRQGKSFLLSLMARYLTDSATDWMSDTDRPLTGFEWKTSIEPETNGIWLSKPFLVKQSEGQEIAVLLMDTQGVFDEYATQRDWSTIVGISLLMSSCLIFNVFTNLQEDILTVLQSFLEYGLEAVRTDSAKHLKPFQNLLFLIRDWNSPSLYNYGLIGGQDFLNRKLQTDRRQSNASQNARRLIRQCFDEISCFLLPDPGSLAKESADFKGRLSELSEQFIANLNELFTNLLNPEILATKTVDGNAITGREFAQYLEVYIEAFNSERMPNPSDLIEATHKATDLNLINKIKDDFLQEMKIVLSDRPFYSRKELITEHNSLKEDFITEYESKKKSKNEEIVVELNELFSKYLKSAFDQIYVENENRRLQTANDVIERLLNEYKDDMNSEMGFKKFTNSSDFELFAENKKREIFEKFDQFCDEEKELFENLSQRLTKQIQNEEKALKCENQKLIFEAQMYYSDLINRCTDAYRRDLCSQIELNQFLEEEVFNHFEEQSRRESEQEFSENCIFGDKEFKNTFEFDFKERLSVITKKLQNLNKENKNKVISNLKTQSNDLLDTYFGKMSEKLEVISAEEEIDKLHQSVKEQLLTEFSSNAKTLTEEFIGPFVEQLEQNFDKSLAKVREMFAENHEKCENYCKNLLNDSKALYTEKLENLFTDSSNIYSDEELNEIQNDIKTEIIYGFNHKPKRGNYDFNEYTTGLKAFIDSEFLKFDEKNKMRRELKDVGIENIRNKFLAKYEDEMEILIKSEESEEDLRLKHNEIKDKILKEFSDLNACAAETNSFATHLQQLSESIEESLEESIIDIFKLQMENQRALTELLIIEARKWYNEEMDKHYQKVCYIKSERLEQINDKVIAQTIKQFEAKRGNMRFDTFEILINDNLKDMFESIKDKNDMNTPTLPAIGIDLGTTNCCVAYFQPKKGGGKEIIVENEIGKNTTPSVVEFSVTGVEVVGDTAKENSYGNPRNTIFSAKRLIGRKFTDSEVQKDMHLWPFEVVDDGSNNPKISVETNDQNSGQLLTQTYFPEQISAKVLKKMKEIAERKLGISVKNAVITVPAYFNDAQKEATKDAGTIAGLNVLKIINEPTAAAIAFQLTKMDDRNARKVLIYDFGGGTFDVAVLVIDRGNIDIKAVNGDNHLGGDDIDNNIVEYCLDEFCRNTGIRIDKSTVEGHRALRRLRLSCEKQKWQLSTTDSTIIAVDAFAGLTGLRVELSRDKFEELNEDLFIRSMDCVEQALNDSQLAYKDIDDIVLVGGSTRIPRIQEMLSDLFDGKQLNHSINPDEAVAVGAAIQAAILNGNQAQTLGHILVKDVAPMSLGVKVKDGFMSTIIHRNSKVPNSYSRIYETTSDYQTEVEVEIYEGEDPMVANNRALGTFTLSKIPSAAAGEQKIDVSFDINDEGILNVNAKIISTGEQQELEVIQHKGRLTDKELEKLREK